MKQNIKYGSGSFSSGDGVKLFEQWWLPVKDSKAVVCIIHGYAEHSGRYAHVGEFLAEHGYAVETFDLRGHGKSEGSRTYVRSFDNYLDDVGLFLTRVRERNPEKPLFLLGHSMGGTIVFLMLLLRNANVRGAIFSGAGLKISDDISPLLQKMSGVIGKILPKLPTIKLDSSAISRDKAIVELYDTDPLNYRGGVPARTGAEIMRATKIIQERMEDIKLPILILHGTADKLTDPEGSKQFYERASSNDKTLKLYEGFYHEVLNDPEKQTVLNDILAWLDAHRGKN